MVTNIEALLERGERLDLLVDKTEQLSSNAVNFKQARIAIQLNKYSWAKFGVFLVAAIIRGREYQHVILIVYII